MTQTSRTTSRRTDYGGKDEQKAKRPFKIGDPLEYRVVRLFVHMGYFARRGRDIYTVGRLDTATDLDVLAIRYAEPFRREVQIAECKIGGEGPLDRVFWLSGVKRYVDANSATLVRASTKWNIKDFATEVGVEILDLPHLDTLERNLGIDSTLWLGSSDRAYFITQLDEWNRAIVRDANTRELFQTLAGEVRFHDPFGGINYLLHQLRALTRDLKEHRFASESLTRFLLAESVAQLSLFLMRIAEMTVGLSAEDRAGLIQKGLTYGHMDKPLIDRLFRNAKRITTEVIKHHTGRDVAIDDTLFRMPESPNVKEVESVVEKLVAQPALAATFSPIVDLLVFEKFAKQKEGIDWMNKVFPYANLRDRLALVQEFLRVLGSIEAVPEALLGTNKREKQAESPTSERKVEPSDAQRSSQGDSDQSTGTPIKTASASLFDHDS